MKKIDSFTIDHNLLNKGLYVSRRDGSITTYDLRMKKPYVDTLMTNAVLHSLEHILATVLRDGGIGENIVYVGPMGCQTGFYVLTKNLSDEDFTSALISALDFIRQGDWTMPGAGAVECGNYLNLDKSEAVSAAAAYYEVIKNLTLPMPYQV